MHRKQRNSKTTDRKRNRLKRSIPSHPGIMCDWVNSSPLTRDCHGLTNMGKACSILRCKYLPSFFFWGTVWQATNFTCTMCGHLEKGWQVRNDHITKLTMTLQFFSLGVLMFKTTESLGMRQSSFGKLSWWLATYGNSQEYYTWIWISSDSTCTMLESAHINS